MAYTDQDIDSAVAAGAIDAGAAAALRAHVQEMNVRPTGGEENFRLVSGFNDIFVAIAAIIMLVAVWWIGNSLQSNAHDYSGPAQDEMLGYGRYKALGAIFCAITAWMLAEYFARIRRMALPSIVLLVALVLGSFIGVSFYLLDLDYTQFGLMRSWFADNPSSPDYARKVVQLNAQTVRESGVYALTALITALMAALFWRRMKVPIAIAATTGMAALALVFGVFYFTGSTKYSGGGELLLFLVVGITIFAYAMWWDISDTDRKTQRSDIAFWLHMLAAPMIAHALFGLIGVSEGEKMSSLAGLIVLGLYAFFAAVAIAVDRRALLVSALAYVLIALTALFRHFGVIEQGVAVTALIIGSALLLLSAFWGPIRRVILRFLPAAITNRLPAAS